MLVLLGAFASLRWGELVNLRRVNVDASAGVVDVADTLSERDDGTIDDGSTKSDAGRRTVSIPAVILPDLPDRSTPRLMKEVARRANH